MSCQPRRSPASSIRSRRGCGLQPGLLAAAAVVAISPTSVVGHQDILRQGLQRSGAYAAAYAATVSKEPGSSGASVAPLPNDTISEEYFQQVDSVIKAAKKHVQASSLASGQQVSSPSPYKQVFSASTSYAVQDGNTLQTKTVSLVPYDMALGAKVLYELTPKGNEEPAPPQQQVSQDFVSQCPQLGSLGDSVVITAPKCAQSIGLWSDAQNSQPLVEWNSQGGSLNFHTVTASASKNDKNLATIAERVTLSQYVFAVSNCIGVPAYFVEETLTKYEDPGHVYYQYIIRAPNGTALLETQKFQTGDDQVNFTILEKDGTNSGHTVVAAQRVGQWTGNAWTKCEPGKGIQGWQVTFLEKDILVPDFSEGTVQDWRVAAAAVVTLLAYRDEDVANDGFQHIGQGSLYWKLMQTILFMSFVLFALGCVCMCWQERGWMTSSTRFLFGVESAFLPKLPAKERLPVLHPTY